jgi:transcriptional regulator with XRE-family HTH domain
MNRGAQQKSEHSSEITAVQIKMARAALGWGVRDLANAAQVSGDTINRVEGGEKLRPRTLAALREALQAAGAEFLPENGVRLSDQVAPKGGSSRGGTRKPRSAGKSARRAR